MPTFNAKLALSSRSCSEKAPFVVHKITIDYAFDQVFKPKMLSLHENITPQILTFMHELPFFPSYFVWNPFCFCRGCLLFLLWIPLCIFLLSFCFSLFSLVPSIISHEIRKTWEFFGKKSIVFGKKSIVFWGYTLTSNV